MTGYTPALRIGALCTAALAIGVQPVSGQGHISASWCEQSHYVSVDPLLYARSCDPARGIDQDAYASVRYGTIGVRTLVTGVEAEPLEEGGGWVYAGWRDRLHWADPNVATVIFTAALTGSYFASYNGAAWAAADVLFESHIQFDRVSLEGDFWMWERAGVGHQGYPPGLSVSRRFDIERRFTFDTQSYSSIGLSMVMGGQSLVQSGVTDQFTGAAGFDFAHTLMFTGLAFLDSGGNVLEGVDYRFENGTLLGPATSVVPEPVSLVLLGTGLAVVGALRRRRRTSARQT